MISRTIRTTFKARRTFRRYTTKRGADVDTFTQPVQLTFGIRRKLIVLPTQLGSWSPPDLMEALSAWACAWAAPSCSPTEMSGTSSSLNTTSLIWLPACLMTPTASSTLRGVLELIVRILSFSRTPWRAAWPDIQHRFLNYVTRQRNSDLSPPGTTLATKMPVSFSSYLSRPR